MPRKPIELPPEVARNFVRDMMAYFAAGHDTIKKDAIAAQQLHALREYLGPRDRKLRLTDIREMFEQMRSAGAFRELEDRSSAPQPVGDFAPTTRCARRFCRLRE